MPPRAKQNARRPRARTITALEEVTQTLETTLDGLRAAHAAVGVGEQPAQQPTPTDIEISNQRAAELTAAREQIARLTASISVMRTHITRLEAGIAAAVRGHMFYHDEYGASIPLEALQPHIPAMMSVNAPQPVTRPFSGEGRRLDE